MDACGTERLEACRWTIIHRPPCRSSTSVRRECTVAAPTSNVAIATSPICRTESSFASRLSGCPLAPLAVGSQERPEDLEDRLATLHPRAMLRHRQKRRRILRE